MVNDKFRVLIVGDLDYEDLIAEIYFEDQILVTLSQESGFENMQIEIYPNMRNKSWLFTYSEFIEIIQHAKNGLWELRKLPETDDKEE